MAFAARWRKLKHCDEGCLADREVAGALLAMDAEANPAPLGPRRSAGGAVGSWL